MGGRIFVVVQWLGAKWAYQRHLVRSPCLTYLCLFLSKEEAWGELCVLQRLPMALTLYTSHPSVHSSIRPRRWLSMADPMPFAVHISLTHTLGSTSFDFSHEVDQDKTSLIDSSLSRMAWYQWAFGGCNTANEKLASRGSTKVMFHSNPFHSIQGVYMCVLSKPSAKLKSS
jgi:hypothetical protein